MSWTSEEEIKLTQHLVDQICFKAFGRSEDECVGNFPRDVYFIGNLRPKSDVSEDNQPTSLRELLSKMSPMAFGAEFRLKPEEPELIVNVGVNWSCYYRIFPTLNQQLSFYQQATSATESLTAEKPSTNPQHGPQSNPVNEEAENELENDSEEAAAERIEKDSPEVALSTSDRKRPKAQKDELLKRFRKITCLAKGRIYLRHIGDEWVIDTHELRDALRAETIRAQQIAMNDPDRIRTSGAQTERVRVTETSLTSAASYASFIRSLTSDVIPEWRWELHATVRQYNDPSECTLLLEFVNASPMPDEAPNTEAFLFDTRADFSFLGGLVLPFELNLAPRSFRNDRRLWGRGFNCSVEPEYDSSGSVKVLATTHTPTHRQMRFVTRISPSARFADLTQDPFPTLEAILNAMTEYKQVWESAENQYANNDPGWQTEFGPEFRKDLQQFEAEIDLFRRGYKLIRSNNDIRLAFQLTNETFLRGDPNKTAWRLFQIVFIVSQIPGIMALAMANGPYESEREMVDIIYFPTGGGKTEAYLGTTVFHCFFDRLRGKTAGVTAWTRFPLRLLTLQQTQRVADIIGLADLVRRSHNDPRLSGPNVDGFAVGYFVGKEATPNDITPPFSNEPPDPPWSQANDPVARQHWKRVVRCPSCRTSTIRVDFDASSVRIIHRCTNHDCSFQDGVIPVYVVDNEIYRYLPSVIVGTIDKLAGIGNQRKLSQIFGQVDGRCVAHGYYKGKCCQKECTDRSRLRPGAPSGVSGPTLFVQDELHLLKEGLGTFDSHYETFVQRLRREFGENNSIKIIASSATIESFARQTEHLYGRAQNQARVFPGLGPTLGESFYAQTLTYPQRLFIGLIPHNKTIFNTMLEIIEYYHREIQNMQQVSVNQPNPYGGHLSPGTKEYRELLDSYITSLSYFSANRELNSIRTDLEGDVNPNLERDGLSGLEIAELTGSTSTDDVTLILEKSEKMSLANPQPVSILATSMISHGVDVDRFNTMIFYGMPRQNAEYIQASSRIGRTHIGVVLCCLHPVRERDQSHYSYFNKFHEFLGQLVEPVAINRWSKFSINRTLPGLFMGILLQLVANNSTESNPDRYYKLDFVKKKISDGTIKADMFTPFLEEAYLVQAAASKGENTFRDEIHVRVQEFLDQIVGSSSGMIFVSDVLIPRPMRSLRDVDDPIEIDLDDVGTQWTNKMRKW
ncbi:helicase-related protein [Dehalogenimonas alkenigignens]|nr:helicase-related protein [Dehalogenimonas alkenigignens]